MIFMRHFRIITDSNNRLGKTRPYFGNVASGNITNVMEGSMDRHLNLRRLSPYPLTRITLNR